MEASQKYSTQVQNAVNKLSGDELSRKVSELVRYFLLCDKKKVPIKRQDINKFVMKEHVKAFPNVFEKAKAKLANVFGIAVMEVENSSKSKLYFLVSELNCEDCEDIAAWGEDESKAGLLMIILSLIFMNQGSLADALLWKTLKQLGVKKDRPHKDLGEVEKVLQDYIRRMYISKEKIVGSEGTSFIYKWGFRSKTEITKRKVLQFISEMYEVNIESWKIQYKEVLEEESER